jgi:hypothetical protein
MIEALVRANQCITIDARRCSTFLLTGLGFALQDAGYG